MQRHRRLMVFREIYRLNPIRPILVVVTRQACRAAATLGLVALAACATTPPADAPKPAAPAASTPAPTTQEAKEALVRQRVQARWDLLIKGDFDGAFEYMSAGSKSTTTLARYKANIRKDAFRSIEIEKVTCDGDACQVALRLTYDHPKMKGLVTPVNESWIVDNGQAWYVYGR